MAGVVALDLSRSGIRGVQVDAPYSTRPTISRFAAVEVPEGTIFDGEIVDQRRAITAIRQLWKVGGFTTKKVVFGISNRKVVVREVSLPVLSGPRRKTSLRFAVEGQVPIDLDDAILDFLPLRNVESASGIQQEGLLVATVRSSLESTVNAIERSGRSIDAIDFSGFSLLRLLPGSQRGTQAIINIGASSTTVVISTGGAPQFVRIVASGGDDITRSIERALGVGFAEAEKDKIARGLQGGAATPRDVDAETVLRENVAGLIDSIRNTFTFWANAHPHAPVSSVVLTGGGSRLGGLTLVLSRALEVPTTYGNPFGPFTVNPKLRESGIDQWALEIAAPLGLTIGAKAGTKSEQKAERAAVKASARAPKKAAKAAKGGRK
ncbi:type IV pilus assembly protein PilM [Microbacterium sp. bgisy203]|uniref:type IV pilus assembly protein PilM n=1 Tax=Microbacterium sp. bgisy203 TaxID=3413799 RepID=UPI003D713B35